MMRITAAARSVGMLEDVDFLEPAEASALAPDKVLYLCTGSQGEPRAALAKIAKGEHPFVKLSKGDAVIFSSRVIPGNERSIGAIQNLLADREIKLVTPKHGNIHVSGHPCRDELRRMYLWARPKISVPVHGERRHIMEHARYALSLQVPLALTPNNGDVIRLAPGSPQQIDEVPTGRLYLDGQTLTPEAAGGMWERKKIAWNGYVGISVVLDAKKLVDGPVVVVKGFSEADGRPADESLEALDEAADTAMRSLKKAEWNEDEAVERVLTRAVRRAAEQTFGKRPLVDVVIHRI
jgi:ribonuclease J